MTTNAERAARGEPIMPDTTNEWNCQPHLEDAFSEVLAGMSKEEQADLTRDIINNQWGNPDVLDLLLQVKNWIQDAAHEQGNY